jgi:hypothetical protein
MFSNSSLCKPSICLYKLHYRLEGTVQFWLHMNREELGMSSFSEPQGNCRRGNQDSFNRSVMLIIFTTILLFTLLSFLSFYSFSYIEPYDNANKTPRSPPRAQNHEWLIVLDKAIGEARNKIANSLLHPIGIWQ